MNNLHKEACQYIVFEKLSLNQCQIHLGYHFLSDIEGTVFGLEYMMLCLFELHFSYHLQ